jgi:hypothetical protein
MFVVHHELENKPNMEFRMHESGLHYYDPRKNEHFAFVNTVSKKQGRFHVKTDKGCRNCDNSLDKLQGPCGLVVANVRTINEILSNVVAHFIKDKLSLVRPPVELGP